jgi:hypothetical protein
VYFSDTLRDMQLTLNRTNAIPDVATDGVILVDGVQKFVSLERAPNDPLRIPAGRYQVTLYQSPEFQQLIPLLIDVPNRSFIEMHFGSFPANSKGCILVGLTEVNDAEITETREAIAELVPMIQAALPDVWLTVADPAE